MPIYEYACESCGAVQEVLQRHTDPPPSSCPKGHRGPQRRILSAHNVGGTASGAEAAFCERSDAPSCGGCGQAGTGCS